MDATALRTYVKDSLSVKKNTSSKYKYRIILTGKVYKFQVSRYWYKFSMVGSSLPVKVEADASVWAPVTRALGMQPVAKQNFVYFC